MKERTRLDWINRHQVNQMEFRGQMMSKIGEELL